MKETDAIRTNNVALSNSSTRKPFPKPNQVVLVPKPSKNWDFFWASLPSAPPEYNETTYHERENLCFLHIVLCGWEA